MSMYSQQVTEALLRILDPLKSHKRAELRDIAIELKQMDGEHWAVGEMLERGCIFLDAYEMPSNPVAR